jgi:hypothetical protein
MLGLFTTVYDRTKQVAVHAAQTGQNRASRPSLLRSLYEMVRVLRGLATTTSIPRESRNRLIQGECIPAFMIPS